MKFEIERCQNGQKGLDFCGSMAIFDKGNRGLTEAGFFAKFLLAQGALFRARWITLPICRGLRAKSFITYYTPN